MTNQEAIEIIRRCLGNLIPTYTDEMDAFGMAIVALQNTQVWIPCSERLPEPGEEVLICCDFGCGYQVVLGFLYNMHGEYYWNSETFTCDMGDVHYWMPIVKPVEVGDK